MAFIITEKCSGCGACKKICPLGIIEGGKKEKHRIDPGACMECGACGRTCPHGAIEDSSGNLCLRIKRSEWEKPSFDRTRCISCRACAEACPLDCIGFSKADIKNDPREYPFLADEKACIGCGACVRECPIEAVLLVRPAAAA